MYSKICSLQALVAHVLWIALSQHSVAGWAGMAYYSRPEDDPYITVHEDSDSEKDDFVLKLSDLLILAARNEDDVSHLEVRPRLQCFALHPRAAMITCDNPL